MAATETAYIAATITILTALLNIAFSIFNTRRQLSIDFEFKRRLAEFDGSLKARAAARTELQKDRSEIIDALISAIKALQEYRDAATYVLRNSSFSEILDCESAKYSHRMTRELAWVEIRCHVKNNELAVVVENWGSKIEPEEVKKIVEFGERGRHAIRPGSGRGLAIVADELDKLGGRLDIKSVRRTSWRKRAETEDDEAHVNTLTAYIPLEAPNE